MVETEFVGSSTTEESDSQARPDRGVAAHRSSPDRVVLVETGNPHGWIAFDADAAVAIER